MARDNRPFIVIQIRTDNEAFGTEGYETLGEVAHILETVKRDIADGYVARILHDSNGNTVGNWSWNRQEGVNS